MKNHSIHGCISQTLPQSCRFGDGSCGHRGEGDVGECFQGVHGSLMSSTSRDEVDQPTCGDARYVGMSDGHFIAEHDNVVKDSGES